MCVILSCEPDKRPTRRLLESCWDSNPDGAGFMYPMGGTVHGFKGFMDLESLAEALASVPDDVPLCVHFRIGTSGGHDERVTHPYPVSDDLSELHATEWEAPCGIAHNGVLHGMFTDDEEGISDTVAYVMDTVTPLLYGCEEEGFPFINRVTMTALESTSIGSLLLLMDGDGTVELTGCGWNACADGITASNRSWAYGLQRKVARSWDWNTATWKVA